MDSVTVTLGPVSLLPWTQSVTLCPDFVTMGLISLLPWTQSLLP